MPVRCRATDALIKPIPAEIDVSAPIKCKQESSDFDDMVRVCHTIDQESPIFSTVGSPDDVDSTGDELGDYELSYLHNLYQGDIQDALLPESEAPPSLGMMGPASALKPVALSALGIRTPASDLLPIAQPDTPPHSVHDSWDDSDDTTPSPRSASPVNSGANKSGAVKSAMINRKRKAASEDAPVSPAKMSKAAAVMAKERAAACSPIDIDSASSSRCSSESPSTSRSNRPMLDGMEIRPEDDPLGLFSRDPATLTPEEQRLLKKQRRLLKNRESAQLSRHRKKCHLHTLEKQVDALKKEKAALQQRVQELLEENERLRTGVCAASAAACIA